jgi:hypothetical protein
MLYRERGDSEGLDRVAALAGHAETADAQVRGLGRVGQAVVAQARGQYADALEIALGVLPEADPTTRSYAYRGALEAAWALEDEEGVERLIAKIGELPPVMARPSLRAHANRYAGLLAAGRGDSAAAAEQLAVAIAGLRELGYRYEMACVLLELGEVLAGSERDEEAASCMREAQLTFAELGARPMLERVERAGASGSREILAS